MITLVKNINWLTKYNDGIMRRVNNKAVAMKDTLKDNITDVAEIA